MNWNKNTFVSLVIIVITLAAGGLLLLLKNNNSLLRLFKPAEINSPISSVQLKFGDKNLKLNSLVNLTDSVLNIFSSDSGENWRGDGNFDDTVTWLSESSILLESRNNTKSEAYLLKKLDLYKYQVLKLTVNLQSDASDLEAVKIYFGNKDKSAYYYYPLINLSPGWNHLRISKMKFSSSNLGTEKTTASASGSLSWNNIERVGIEVNSRFNSVAKVNIESMTAYQAEDYLDNWLTMSTDFLDLTKTKEGSVVLTAKNVGASTALIKKIGGVSDFTLKAKVQPLKISARSGLFIRGDYNTGYGYYFLIDGVNGNRWQIIKIGVIDKKTVTTVLRNGVISNFAVEKKQPIWLKAEAKGSSLKFFVSADNKTYTLLGETTDNEFREGGVGITVFDGGATLYDEIEFTQ